MGKIKEECGVFGVYARKDEDLAGMCYYGTDIDSREHLIACHHSVEEIARIIGADSLGYLEVEDLAGMIGTEGFCHACFSGDYPTSIPTHREKTRFERRLSEKKGDAQ